MNGILNTILTGLPGLITLIRDEHAKANPGGAVPTDAEVIAGLHEVSASVIAKGEKWKAEHPPTNGDTGE